MPNPPLHMKRYSMEMLSDTVDGELLKQCSEHSGCAGKTAGLPLRGEFGFTAIEDVTLDLVRLVCHVYATGDAANWDAALKCAEDRLGPLDGPEFMSRVALLMSAVRIERQGRFIFMSAGCCHICNDELLLQSVIKVARQGDTELVHEIAVTLACSGHVNRIEQAAHALGALQARRNVPVHGQRPETWTTLDRPSAQLH